MGDKLGNLMSVCAWRGAVAWGIHQIYKKMGIQYEISIKKKYELWQKEGQLILATA